MKIDPDLLQAIRKNELIIFAGAGLSYNLTNIKGEKIEGWGNLVNQILNNLEEKGVDVSYLKPSVSKIEPIDSLNLIEKYIRTYRKDIIEFVKDFFYLDEERNDFFLHKSLFQLSKKIITTNYDRAFELAVPDLRRNTAHKGKNYELTTLKDASKPSLFKLHGCLDQGDSMVLFPSNYDELYNDHGQDAEHALLIFRSIVMNKTILFVGTGMGDFQINSIFSEIKRLQGQYNQKHFIITKEILDSKLDFLTPIQINDFSEIVDVIQSLIEEKERILHEKLPETERLEEQLMEAQKQWEMEMERIKSRSLKYFIEGLEYHLKNDFERAIEKYEIATDIDENNGPAFRNWGTALSDLAKQQNSPEIYLKSFEMFEKATSIIPRDPNSYFNWGNAISDLARKKPERGLYELSFKKYEKAADLSPEDASIYNNWGNAMLNMKKWTKETNNFKQIFEKFQKSTSLSPTYTCYSNWGNALSFLGQIKNDIKQIEESLEMYEKASLLNPNVAVIYNNWGNALLNLAVLTSNGSFFEKSFEKLNHAVELGGHTYNVACAHALTKNKEKALKNLENSLDDRIVTAEYVKRDFDWKDYLEDQDFQSLLTRFE